MVLRKITGLAFLVVCLISFAGCDKDSDDQKTELTIRLTDNPFNASEVNVEILDVRVNFRDDDEGWESLPTNSGVYNLLEFQNGVDTVLAQGWVSTGRLKEVRFILGDNNSITINNVNYPLSIPSGSESGLKIKINQDLAVTFDELLIDFDAALSIMQTGNGEYKLKPVLRVL